MNPDQAKNRMIATLVGGLLVPHIEEVTGIKLSPADVEALIVLVPVIYHGVAALGQSVKAAFLTYFPPPVRPTTPAEPAGVQK